MRLPLLSPDINYWIALGFQTMPVIMGFQMAVCLERILRSHPKGHLLHFLAIAVAVVVLGSIAPSIGYIRWKYEEELPPLWIVGDMLLFLWACGLLCGLLALL